MSEPIYSRQREDGTWFHAEKIHDPNVLPYLGGCETEEDFKNWLAEKWRQMVEAKRPETAAMMRRDRLWAGFHYKEPNDNREKEITNLCFSKVESIWSSMVESSPRPRCRPRANASPERAAAARAVDQFADILMDEGGFDEANEVCQRNKVKSGINLWMVFPDPETGQPIVKAGSPYHVFVDPAATDIGGAQMVCIAGPAPTEALQAMFPDHAASIKPDNFVGPEYAVTHEVYERFYATDLISMRQDIPGKTVTRPGEPEASTSTTFVLMSPGGGRQTGRKTSWFVTFYFRDPSETMCVAEGYVEQPHPTLPGETVKIYGQYEDRARKTCESGWRIVSMTADGTIVQNEPLDPCYKGLPIVIGRRYPTTERFWSLSEIDQIASLVLHMNMRKDLLNTALRNQSTKVWKSTPGIGVAPNLKRNYIEDAEVIELSRGGDLQPLEMRGPQAEQFAMLQTEAKDVNDVGGVQDAQEGARPAGIEAYAAIRALQSAAATRQKGHLPAYLREMREVVTKMLSVAQAKMQGPYRFYAADGAEVNLDLTDLTDDFAVKFDLGSALATYREANEEKMLTLVQAGIIDRQAYFEETSFPGWQPIEMRMQVREAQAAQAQAQANAKKMEALRARSD